MIARITLVAAAVSAWGLLTSAASAQLAPYPVVPVGYTSCDAGCAETAPCDAPTPCDVACDEGCDGGCDGSCNGAWGDWLSVRRPRHQHNPYCHCMLCRPRHTWATFDALMWWGKGREVPVLATTSPNSGVLPDAEILFGGASVGRQMAPGARVDFGFWFDQCETLGLGAKVWGLHGDRSSFSATSDTHPLLARPFYNILGGAEDAVLVASPGLLTGTLNVTTSSSVLGGEAYLRSSMLSGCGYNIDLLGGYHFMRLDDDINIHSASTVQDIAVGAPVGTVIDVLDSFDARNEFHGGELGVVGEFRRGRWTVTNLLKLSVGNMRQTVTIDGRQTNTTPGGVPSTTVGGVLAQPTNIGTYTRDQTAWIPELNISAAYEVRRWLRLSIGYSALWISDIAFSGDQIDRVVNPSQFSGGLLIGPARPAFTDFTSTEYWLHGLNLGATITF